MKDYVDLFPDLMVLLTRIALGAIAGAIFHSQVTGFQAAIAVGASAPGLLSQLGNTRIGRSGGEGTELSAVPSIQVAVVDPPKSAEG